MKLLLVEYTEEPVVHSTRISFRNETRSFIRMDRNGDGDLTLREWLGTKEQFQNLDKNSDGFIEQAEALAASESGTKSLR